MNFEYRRPELQRKEWELGTIRRRARRKMIKCQSHRAAVGVGGKRSNPTLVCHDGGESTSLGPPRHYVFLQRAR